jgi:FAD/FMN-containing dehydrogenase
MYRRMAELIKKNRALIERARPKVLKNSAGYALWDVGDGEQSLNLARLMSGAQGTLGIITSIRFSLVHPLPYSAMTVLMLKDSKELGALAPEVLAYGPDSFESYDDHTFSLAVKYFPEFAAQMKTGLVHLAFSFLPEVWMLLTGGIPKLVLMAEFRAATQEEAGGKAEKLAREIRMKHPKVGVRVAPDERAARKYWTIRRESFNLLRKKIRGKRTAPFIDDFVVPPKTFSDFLPKLDTILLRYDLTYTIAGHVGDGNFHIIPLIDPKQSDIRTIIERLGKEVYDLVLAEGGSTSGEHNDGFIRTPYVEQMFGPEMTALFREVKNIFDPHNIFNPGKKVGTTFAQAMAHLDLPPVKKS